MEVEPNNSYFIWGIDDSPYGPVPLPVLINWIQDERVVADTWIFARPANCWQKASDLPELNNYFGEEIDLNPLPQSRAPMSPGSLRRIKILADLKDAQLAHLAEFLELQEVKQFKSVIHQGDMGDAMFMVLAGELRARTTIGGRETILTTFSPGDIFGEMALFDHGPRSADVVANVDSALLKLSSIAFQRLTREAPSLSTPFLQATSRTLAARIRADNKRLTRITEQYSAGNSL